MFIFKKIVSQFFFPLPLILFLSLVGLFFLWFTKKQKLGKVLVSIGTLALFILSYPVIPNSLLAPLERKYKPYTERSLQEKDRENTTYIKYIVILGGGHVSDQNLPLTGQLSQETLIRLAEGIRIHRKCAKSKLIVSGGGDPVSNATLMAELAVELGVNTSDIIIESESRDTKDEARIIKEIVKKNAFVLVTSASHMPRSMAMFKRLGMDPVPAPTAHNVKATPGVSPGSFFPSAFHLRNAEKAVYEYLGIIWAKLRGQI
jgi:uncharacterized SAM-binding protein YcdF (DUF218 family)